MDDQITQIVGDRNAAQLRSQGCAAPEGSYASWMSCQVTAALLYGGMTSFFAIGAVVDGVPTTFQTPLSGHRSPVRAVVPMVAMS
ncbi:hypothetical protein AB0M43_28675 [Longispora sp. NPDC051575]|uniref:hypothetical protein n=1 Tax=Longispora sp. NPDC051575 TaxID=3154943 RepID=UPI003441836C